MNEQDRGKFIELQSEVNYIKDNVNEIKIKQEHIDKKFDKLFFHLIGDKDTNTRGMIEDFSNLKVRLSTLEKVYAILGGVLSAVIIFKDKIINALFG